MERLVSFERSLSDVHTTLICPIYHTFTKERNDPLDPLDNLSNSGVFSRDVTAAMLVFLNNGTAAMLVSPTNPPGIELYYHANVFFCFGEKTSLLIT